MGVGKRIERKGLNGIRNACTSEGLNVYTLRIENVWEAWFGFDKHGGKVARRSSFVKYIIVYYSNGVVRR